MTNLVSLQHLLPELALAGGAVVLFLLAAAARRPAPWQGWAFPGVAGLSVGVALLLLVATCLGGGGGGVAEGIDGCLGRGGCTLFGGMLATDPMSVFFRGLAIVATGVGVVLSMGSPSLPEERRGEYFALLLVLAMGMCLLASSSNLLMIYVSMETVSLCSYLLAGWDSRRARSAEAGLKYVLYGGVASAVMLFGMSLLYGLFGELSLNSLGAAVTGRPALASVAGQWAGLVAVVFVLGGLGYKVAAVPFHMWCPDVYEGAPTPFTALLSVAPKAAGFAVLLRFFHTVLPDGGGPDMLEAFRPVPWLPILGAISVLTMTLGNLAAIVQDNLKRLLAYSSIAHAGYMLLGVVAGGQTGFSAVALYAGVYFFMNMGAFAVVAAVDRKAGSEHLSAYRGLGRREPFLALLMVVFLFSLTGLPPTAGFVGKVYLFAALLERGGSGFVALAVVGVLNSVVSLYYYARVLKAMYLESAEEAPETAAAGAVVTAGRARVATGVALALAVPTLLFGLYWQPLAEIASWSATYLR